MKQLQSVHFHLSCCLRLLLARLLGMIQSAVVIHRLRRYRQICMHQSSAPGTLEKRYTMGPLHTGSFHDHLP